MIKLEASCEVMGEGFSPAAFAKMSSVRLVDANEPGAIGDRGRYRGKPTPRGSASIEVSNKVGDWPIPFPSRRSCAVSGMGLVALVTPFGAGNN